MELFSRKKAAEQIPKEAAAAKRDDELSSTSMAESSSSLVATTSASAASTFAELGLCDWICHAVSKMGFRNPTDIQRACIPAIMQDRDVMGCAETGSG